MKYHLPAWIQGFAHRFSGEGSVRRKAEVRDILKAYRSHDSIRNILAAFR